MKYVIMIAIALYTCAYNGITQAMLCQFACKRTNYTNLSITRHKKYHSTHHTSTLQEFKTSYHCLNRLNKIDNNLPAFFRYLQIKLEDKTIQEHYAGRPSLIIEKYKNNAPSITEFHDADYLNHYLPDTYELLDSEFEKCYRKTSDVYTTKDRINEAFLHLTRGQSLQRLTLQATNKFKLHMIRTDKCNPDIKIYLGNGQHTTDSASLKNTTKE